MVVAGESPLLLTAARRSLEPVGAHGLRLERPSLDGELVDLEVGLVTKHREHDATEAVGNGDHRHLVATPGTELGEVGVERMVGARARCCRR